jgi:probable rRNA maturation factor
MFSLHVIEKPQFSYSQNTLDEIAERISKHILTNQNWLLNIIFLDSFGIQNLNKTYRNIDTATDVLSFHYYEDFSELWDDDIAGELIFCEEKIISQWIEYELWTEHEFYKLVIHSLLHIIGFDHEEDSDYAEMKKWEDIIWNELFWISR